MSSSFVDYFDVNTMILKLGGIWIPENTMNRKTKILYLIYNGFWMIYSIILYIPSEFIILNASSKNFNNLIKNLNMSVTHLLAIIKTIIWFTNRKKIINIIQTLKNASATYEAVKDFRPDEIIKLDKIQVNFYTKTFLYMACGVSMSSLINATFWALTSPKDDMKIFNNLTNETSYNYTGKLTYFSYVPWDYTSSTKIYIITLCYQFLPTFSLAFVIVGFDTLFVTIVSYTSSQLLILQGAFRTIKERCLKKLDMNETHTLHDPKQLSDEMMKELRNCIKHLQVIFK